MQVNARVVGRHEYIESQWQMNTVSDFMKINNKSMILDKASVLQEKF